MDRNLEKALEAERKKQQDAIAAKEREARQAEAITVASEALTGAMAQVLQGEQGEQGLKGDDGQDGKDGRDGKDGLDGKDGKDGRDGIDGQDGKDGLDGKDGRDGKDGKQGPAGAPGPRGQDGEKGEPPRHQIQNGKVRFEQASGNWGNWISLQNVTIKNGGGGGGAQVVNTENVVYSHGVDHLYSLQEAINHIWSPGGSGRAEDFAITENGDGTIDITGGDAVLRSTEDPDGELKAYTVPCVNNLLLTDNATNYILVDYNNGDPIIAASANLNDVVNVITKTTIYAINRLGNELNIVDTRAFNVDFMRKNALKDYKVHGFEHAGGAFVSDLGNRNIAVTASEFYLLNQGIQSLALDTSTTGVFEYVYQDGLGSYTRAASQTQIDNLNYDDGSGTLAVVGTNKYFCHYVYLVLNNPSHYKVVYGRELHNQLAEAQAEQIPSTLPSDLDPLSTAVFIGKIIVLQGVDAFEDIQSPFTQILTSAVANNHANLAGLQGGTVDDYQHLTTAEVELVNGAIQSTEKGAVNGVATLGAGGKIPAAQLPSSVMEYLGNWNASTNTPTLIDGTGDSGDVYRVNVSGTQDLGSGSQTFAVGDWVVYSGSIWERSDNADAVSSVNGQVGTVVLDADDIDDSSTAHKFVTSTDLTNLSNLSGTNTGDVTVLDTSEIDLSLAGQQISASIVAGSIDESKLDASVNASLDLADSAVQQNDSPTFNQVTTTGRVVVDDDTNSTSTTTGSIQTDGGLGVAKDTYLGGTLIANTITAKPTSDAGTALTLQNNAGLRAMTITAPANGTKSAPWIFNTTNSWEFQTDDVSRLTINASGDVSISGNLSKGSGSFRIDHPLSEMEDTHYLYHSFVEAPQADNLYSGIAKLEQGKAVINLDQHSNMNEGTFTALNKNIRTFTNNEQTWDNVRGRVEGNQLIIECQDPEAAIQVSWLVIGERQDKKIKDAPWVDDEGNNVIEQLKV